MNGSIRLVLTVLAQLAEEVGHPVADMSVGSRGVSARPVDVSSGWDIVDTVHIDSVDNNVVEYFIIALVK